MIEMEHLIQRHSTPPSPIGMNPVDLSSYNVDEVSLSSTSTSAFGESLQTGKNNTHRAEIYSNSSSVGDTSSAASSIEFLSYPSPKEDKTQTPDQGISLTASISELDSSTSRPPTTTTSPTNSDIIDEIILTMIKQAQELSLLSDCNTPTSSSTKKDRSPRKRIDDTLSLESSGDSSIKGQKEDSEKVVDLPTTASTKISPSDEFISLEVDSLLKELEAAPSTQSNRLHKTPKFSQMEDSYTTNKYVSLVREAAKQTKSNMEKEAALIRTTSWAADISSQSLPHPAKSVPTTPIMSRYRMSSGKIRPDKSERPEAISNAKSSDDNAYFSHKSAEPKNAQSKLSSFVSKLSYTPLLKPMGFNLNHPTLENSEATLTRCDETPSSSRMGGALIMHNPAMIEGCSTLPLLRKNYDLPSNDFDTPRSISKIEEFLSQQPDNLWDSQSADKMQALREVAMEDLLRCAGRSPVHTSRVSHWSNKELVRNIRNKFSKPPPPEPSIGDNLFGLPLHLIQAQNGDGCPFPRFIMDIMDFINENCTELEGIFRRSGLQRRIQEMREVCGNLSCQDPLPEDCKNLAQVNDLGDLFKLYFRSLPHQLISETLTDLVPAALNNKSNSDQFEIIKLMVMTLPDENRDALLILLDFLGAVAEKADKNCMNADNLATCIMPSICAFKGQQTATIPNRRRKTIAGPITNSCDPVSYKIMRNVIRMLIENRHKLGEISPRLMTEVAMRTADRKKKRDLRDVLPPMVDLSDSAALKCFVALLFKEFEENWKGWPTHLINGMQVSTREVGDLSSLKSCRVQFTLHATPQQIVGCLLSKRESWDFLIDKCGQSLVDVENKEDISYITYRSVNPSVTKRAITARIWHENEAGSGRAYIAEKTCKCDPNAINPEIFHSAFLICPLNGKSIVNYISRIDLKGKSVEWYENTYKHIMVVQMKRFIDVFNQCFSD